MLQKTLLTTPILLLCLIARSIGPSLLQTRYAKPMIQVSGMHGTRFKGLVNCMQIMQQIILFQVIILAGHPDVAH